MCEKWPKLSRLISLLLRPDHPWRTFLLGRKPDILISNDTGCMRLSYRALRPAYAQAGPAKRNKKPGRAPRALENINSRDAEPYDSLSTAAVSRASTRFRRADLPLSPRR